MRKLPERLAAALCLVAATYYFGSALLYGALQYRIEWDCSLTQSTPECLNCMRGLGTGSSRDDLPRAERWYALTAVQGDVVAMFDLAWVDQKLALDALTWSADQRDPVLSGQDPAGAPVVSQSRRSRVRTSDEQSG